MSTTYILPNEESLLMNTTKPALDPEIIRQLRGLEDPEAPGLLAELVEIFTRDATQHIDELAEALYAGDRPRVRRLAHRIKGGAGSIAAIPLAALFGRMEAECDQDVPGDRLEMLLSEIRGEYERVREALDREVSGQDGGS